MEMNRTCIACGTTYKYCNGCHDYSSLPAWKNIFDTDNCRKIFHAVSDYLLGGISDEEAIDILKNCDLTNIDSFSKRIQETVEKLVKKEEIVAENEVNDSEPLTLEKENNILPKMQPTGKSNYERKKR